MRHLRVHAETKLASFGSPADEQRGAYVIMALAVTSRLMIATAIFLLAPHHATAAQDVNPYYTGGHSNRWVDFALGQTDEQIQRGDLPNHVFWLTWGYVAPESKHYLNRKVLDRLIVQWDYIAYQYRVRSSSFEAGGVLSYVPFLESIRFLQTASYVPSEKLTIWKSALRERIEQEFVTYVPANAAESGAGEYANFDAQNITLFYLSYLVYGDEKFLIRAKELLSKLAGVLHPDGGFEYFRHSTPVPLYHSFEVAFLGRYWQLSGDPVAADLLRRTVRYYPYTFVPEDTAEYSSAPWWKQMWAPRGGAFNAVEIVAGLTKDGHNKWLAEQRSNFSSGSYFDLYSAAAWDPGITPVPFPDNYVVTDSNVYGVRGRFGRFSWVGSRGKYTMSFGGCMVADLNLPDGYDGYLQLAHLGVKTTEGIGPYSSTLRMVGDINVVPTPGASFAGQDYAVNAVSYVPRLQSDPNTEYNDWRVEQIWLYTNNTVVAYFEATALRDGVTTKPEGIVRLGPYMRPFGFKGSAFNIGNLHGRILQHNFGNVVTRDGEPDVNHHDARHEIRLSVSGGSHALSPTYPRDTKFYYALQLSPSEEMGPASIIKKSGDPQTLEIVIGMSTYRISFDSATMEIKALRGEL